MVIYTQIYLIYKAERGARRDVIRIYTKQTLHPVTSVVVFQCGQIKFAK